MCSRRSTICIKNHVNLKYFFINQCRYAVQPNEFHTYYANKFIWHFGTCEKNHRSWPKNDMSLLRNHGR